MKKYFSMMLLLAAMFLTFSACSSDDYDDEKRQEPKDTTYTFTYMVSNQPEEFTVDITLFEYNEKGERVAQNHVKNCRKGYKETFKASSISQKVKVYVTSSKGDQSIYRWIQQVYYLEKEKNTPINITGETKVGTNEP